MGAEKYQLDGDPRTSGPGFGVAVHSTTLAAPLAWKRPRLVFVNSMSDLFHARVPDDFILSVFDIMAATPQHTYQLLTKRSLRLRRLGPRLSWPKNLWMGVTVESDEHVRRVDDLRQVPAAVRFISAEPLLGPLPSLDLTDVHWLIAGGESGTGARPMEPAWLRTLRDLSTAAGTSFFFKQWGGRTPKAGGRELDGRTWDQMPHDQVRRTTLPKDAPSPLSSPSASIARTTGST